MTFVNLSASGYSCSSIAVLKSSRKIGERKGVRSFMMAGLILNMSLALFGFILFITFCISSSVMCTSVNGGFSLFSICSVFSGYCSCCWGMVSLVLCPIVM